MTISHNESVLAGGIYNVGQLNITNSTVSNNTATNNSGIDNLGVLILSSSTITGNVSLQGGGLAVRPVDHKEIAMVSNTILADNTAAQGPDCFGVVISLGHNLVGTNSGCEIMAVAGDKIGTEERPLDAMLGELGIDGGPTATNALLPGSPAIDAADGSTCPPVDQRGVQRPNGPSCDIGSYER